MKLRVIGVMTGNSCDGLDSVLMQFRLKQGWFQSEFLERRSTGYPEPLRRRIVHLQKTQEKSTFLDSLYLNRDLGSWMGDCLVRLWGGELKTVGLIANHGQTVVHLPSSKGVGISVQLGDPSQIATRTGCSVASHFRQGDIAAGGQGAPLAPLYHLELAQKSKFPLRKVVIHNLGGISNLTAFKSPLRRTSQTVPGIFAFDTGPANLWIDEATLLHTRGRANFDSEGALARQGRADQSAIHRIMKLPFFNERPPKSTGRDQFPFHVLTQATRSRGEDLIATALEIVVESIKRAYEVDLEKEKIRPQVAYFCGGGAKNLFLMERLQNVLPKISILSVDELGMEPMAVEAAAFATLGMYSVLGYPIGGPWTQRRPVFDFAPPGWLTPGRNYAILQRFIAKSPIQVHD